MTTNPTPPDRCPNCGQPENDVGKYYGCGSTIRGDYRSPSCRELAVREQATVLRDALRMIRDTHDPGTIAGDVARRALKEAGCE